MNYTLGLGYRREEYALFGVRLGARGRDVEDRITRMLDAWADGAVTPAPYSRPHPFLFYGGGSPPRPRSGPPGSASTSSPSVGGPELKAAYEDECRAQGREPGFTLRAPDRAGEHLLRRRPGRFWERYGHHLLADARGLRRVAGRRHDVVRPRRLEHRRGDAGRGRLRRARPPTSSSTGCRAGEVRLVTSHPACGGLPADRRGSRLRLISETVLPAVRE